MADFRIDITNKKLVKKHTAITEPSTIDVQGTMGSVEGSVKITNNSGASQLLTFPSGGLLPHHLPKSVTIPNGKVLEVFFSTGFVLVWWSYNLMTAVDTEGQGEVDAPSWFDIDLAAPGQAWVGDASCQATWQTDHWRVAYDDYTDPSFVAGAWLDLPEEISYQGFFDALDDLTVDLFQHQEPGRTGLNDRDIGIDIAACNAASEALFKFTYYPGESWQTFDYELPGSTGNTGNITKLFIGFHFIGSAEAIDGDYLLFKNLQFFKKSPPPMAAYTLSLPPTIWVGKRYIATDENISLELDDSVKINGKSMIVKVKNTDTENAISVNVGEGYITDGFTGTIGIPAGGYAEITVTYDNDSADWHPQAFTQIA